MPTKPFEELEAKVGKSRQTVAGLTVEAGKVAEFAGAIGDGNAVYRNDLVAAERGHPAIPAPLTFTRTGYFPRYRTGRMDKGLGFDLGFRPEYTVHGAHEYVFERPVYVGDTLTGKTKLGDVYRREGNRGGTLTFAVYETVYSDRDEELVLTEQRTRIETEGAIDEDESTEEGVQGVKDTTTELENRIEPCGRSIGDSGPVIVVEDIEREDFVRYAGASGDFNPIHYDEPYAIEAGNESVFGQGMLVAGYASRVVTDWFGVEAIERFSVRFRNRVWPGDTLTATGQISDVERGGGTKTVTADLVVRNEYGEQVLTGDARATITQSSNSTDA